MNKQRRSELLNISNELVDLMERLGVLGEEEQEALDNMPDSLQDGPKGERMQEIIDGLEEAFSDIQDIVDNLAGLAE